ncbi:MAG: MFS transporter [Halobacteriovoraceae bacterium]|jgi:ATP:ADP antiporter, AAA family|nr:MFS transporter [Halobacteriovoraceae bacterium]
MKSFFQCLEGFDARLKKTSFFILLTYFLALFSYPLVRSATGAIFYDVYTANDYSFASFIGVLVLMVMISINNYLQSKIGVHKLYLTTGILSIVTLLVGYIGYKMGFKQMAYVIFAAKEAYIVLLVHICLAFANSTYNLEQFKRLIGPIGAVGSIGGIIGGQLTSYLASTYNTEIVFMVSLLIILFTVLAFYFTGDISHAQLEVTNRSITPIRAIRGVKKYVFLIGAVVALSQFVIFIADLQFNMVFEKVITIKDERTAYFGQFYSYVNIVALFLQFMVLPFLLVRVKLRSIFLFIPLFYFILVFGGLSFGAGSLYIVGSVFVSMKGIDYSLFAAVKDIMYHPLLSLQKFGAKYITDMFVYRVSKALIAFTMAQIAISDMKILTQLQFVFLFLWGIVILFLFKEQKKLKH